MARCNLSRLQHLENNPLALVPREVKDCDWGVTLSTDCPVQPPGQGETLAPDGCSEAGRACKHFQEDQVPEGFSGYALP